MSDTSTIINGHAIKLIDNGDGTFSIGAELTPSTSLIGKVGIDQATANANEVVVKSITAGANIIGQVGIDQTTDGTTNKIRTVLKQSSSAPAASPVTVDTTAGGAVLIAANASRLSVTLQNVGTEPCIVRLGGNPTNAAYNFILGEDSAAREGNGASVTIRDYTGEIKGLTEANSTVIAVMEVA